MCDRRKCRRPCLKILIYHITLISWHLILTTTFSPADILRQVVSNEPKSHLSQIALYQENDHTFIALKKTQSKWQKVNIYISRLIKQYLMRSMYVPHNQKRLQRALEVTDGQVLRP